MTSRPIIFSGESVRAILAGLKTQTRRVVKNEFGVCDACFAAGVPHDETQAAFGGGPYLRVAFCEHDDTSGGRTRCPYGRVGDRLWVKETWRLRSNGRVAYGANSVRHGDARLQWRSSLFMPRRLARLSLAITNVRIERLCAISAGDACLEGLPVPLRGSPFAIDWYRMAWDKINATRGFPWASDPWVWVLTFETVR